MRKAAGKGGRAQKANRIKPDGTAKQSRAAEGLPAAVAAVPSDSEIERRRRLAATVIELRSQMKPLDVPTDELIRRERPLGA